MMCTIIGVGEKVLCTLTIKNAVGVNVDDMSVVYSRIA